MFRPRIIPCLQIRGQGLVKTVKFGKAAYIGDPINAVRLFNDLEADELCFLDIDATREGRTISTGLVERIGKEAFMPFSVGGGIRSLDQAKGLIAAGAEKVIVNTAAAERAALFRELSDGLGSQSVIASIDAKKDFFGRYRAVIAGGTRMIDKAPWELARELESEGAGEIVINSVERDGTLGGYDLELVRSVAESVSVPVIALGGAGSYSDLGLAVRTGGACAAAAGSIFVFYGAQKAVLINYPSKAEKISIFSLDS